MRGQWGERAMQLMRPHDISDLLSTAGLAQQGSALGLAPPEHRNLGLVSSSVHPPS